MTSLIPLLRIDPTKGFNTLVKTIGAEESPKGKQMNSKSRVPLKSQILVMARMYGYRKVGILRSIVVKNSEPDKRSNRVFNPPPS